MIMPITRLKELGGSEAEVVRRAIDQQIQLAADLLLPPDPQALEAIIQFALERRRTTEPGEVYQWKREDAYEERGQQWGQSQPPLWCKTGWQGAMW